MPFQQTVDNVNAESDRKRPFWRNAQRSAKHYRASRPPQATRRNATSRCIMPPRWVIAAPAAAPACTRALPYPLPLDAACPPLLVRLASGCGGAACTGGGGPADAATARIMRAIHSYLMPTFSARSTMLLWSFTHGLQHTSSGSSTERRWADGGAAARKCTGQSQVHEPLGMLRWLASNVQHSSNLYHILYHTKDVSISCSSHQDPAQQFHCSAASRKLPSRDAKATAHLRGSSDRMRSSNDARSPRCISTMALPIDGRTLPRSSRSSMMQSTRLICPRRPLGLGTSSGVLK